MARYVVGDLQGCGEELQALLAEVAFDTERDVLYPVGDLVNRGPESLEVLRWAYRNRACVKPVLGNHDLHLIAVHAGCAKLKKGDTLAALLEAPDAEALIGWLRSQPLVRRDGRYLMVHAGLLPAWDAEQALALSGEVEAALQSARYAEFLAEMYGNQPDRWRKGLTGWDRLRVIVNACTRMRVLDGDRLEMKFKGELQDVPPPATAWFDAPGRRSGDAVVVCGHWSALGLLRRPDLIALDTGCVWGGALSAVSLDDGKLFQVPSRQPRQTDWS